MLRSIRWRLLLWYAGMLLVVIVGFASYLYWSAERAAFQQLDVRLEGAARYLEAALKPFPVRELLRPVPFSFPPGGSPGMMRDGMSKDGFPRDYNDKRLPEKRSPDKRGFENDKRGFDFDPERRPPMDGERREGERRPPPDGERRPPLSMPREAERMRNQISLRTSTDADDVHKEPLFFTIYKANGTIFKTSDDPITDRDPKVLEAKLSDATDPVFHDSTSARLALYRGPERSLILVGISVRPELGRLDTLLYQLIASGGLALAFGLLGSWFISGRITQPLKEISTTASLLSATHLKERIPTEHIDTELVEVATVLNDTFNRLEAAFQRQSQFTADAGHELRTPLAVLHANLELALSRPRKESEYRETLESCLATSTRMRSLIDALLMIARADAGQLQAQLNTLDLRQVVEAGVGQYLDHADNIQLNAELPSTPIKVKGDPTLLGMVLTNLISNALRHTQKNGHVTVAAGIVDQHAELTVTDDGIGIPTEAQAHLFERFFRVDESRSRHTGGHGLGLAICKSLVEVHHGTIHCESTPGQGTRFTIRLPLAGS